MNFSLKLRESVQVGSVSHFSVPFGTAYSMQSPLTLQSCCRSMVDDVGVWKLCFYLFFHSPLSPQISKYLPSGRSLYLWVSWSFDCFANLTVLEFVFISFVRIMDRPFISLLTANLVYDSIT